MRVVIATVIILIIFIVGTVMLNGYVDTSCEKLLDNVKELHTLIEGNRWNNAQKQFTTLEKEIESTKNKWQLFLEHYEMDAIDIAIVRLGQYVDIEEPVLSLGEVAELKLLISQIRDKERLKLVNIL